MKKFVLSFGLLALSFGLFAQTIPNNDFENWEANADFPDYNDPVDWGTSNYVIDLGLSQAEFNTVTQVDTDVYSGDYAAKATNVTQDVMGSPSTIPGIITLGEFVLDLATQSGSIEGGLPFTDRPVKLKGYFKAAPEPGDSAMIAIGLSKWNDTNGERDTIGWGIMYSADIVDTWTEFEIPIDWTSTENPDSMNIVISPSNLMDNDVFIEGSSVTVDSVWLDYTEPEELNIASVETLTDITVDFGTAFGDVPLPDSLGVTLDDSSTDTLAVTWNQGSYDGNTAGTYTIYGDLTLEPGIINTDGLQGEVDVIVDEEVGIVDNKNNDLNIYPNPASDIVYIESGDRISKIQMFDLTGRTILRKQVNKTMLDINVNDLPEGHYMLHVTTNKNDYTVKLIVN
ncbi:MAG: T9SS type A sorting domain-containing protein [Bacteroidota bacterium]